MTGTTIVATLAGTVVGLIAGHFVSVWAESFAWRRWLNKHYPTGKGE